jgi:hypothetical protein
MCQEPGSLFAAHLDVTARHGGDRICPFAYKFVIIANLRSRRTCLNFGLHPPRPETARRPGVAAEACAKRNILLSVKHPVHAVCLRVCLIISSTEQHES